ncbi:MAG: hypothetical protein ACPGWS_08765, partial [Solirubrobacterales bacterium]
GGIQIDIPYPTGARGKDFREYEVHTSDTSGFTPAAGTLKARGRSRRFTIQDIAAGELAYVKVIGIDTKGNRVTSPATQVSGTVGYHGAANLNPDGAWGRGLMDQGFNVTTRGDSFPPDQWNMRTGAWDDTNTAELSSTARLGDQSIILHGVTSTVLESSYRPVKGGTAQRFEIGWQQSSILAGRELQVQLEWHSAKGTVVSTESVFNKVADAINTWQSDGYVTTAPATARWAKVLITASNGEQAIIDGVEFTEIYQSFKAYRNTDQTAISQSTATKLDIGTESYDYGGMFDDATNNRFDVPTDGLYSISAGVTVTDCNLYARIMIYKNGVELAKNGGDSANEAADGGEVSRAITLVDQELVAGDYIEVYFIGDDSGGGTITALGNEEDTWFTGRRTD